VSEIEEVLELIKIELYNIMEVSSYVYKRMKLREKFKLYWLRKQFDYAYTKLELYTSHMSSSKIANKLRLIRACKWEDRMYTKDQEINEYAKNMILKYA
jgi:hypothetical protein